MTGQYLINLGAGPVADANLADATENARTFAAQVGDYVSVRRERGSREQDGRWAFVRRAGSGSRIRRVDVDMPGVPLADLTRRLPVRLYIDGNSWMWHIAVDICRAALRLPFDRAGNREDH